MKAVDLYSGVGGWSLGLSMAGIEVVASYDLWAKANLTNSKNNAHPATKVDIRNLDPGVVPSVDIVVGSPPCTQFSLANRGGNGNIHEGLKDVEKFLEIVDAVRPKFWAMENVPRLASIACKELNQGGTLHRFCHLNPDFMILDLSEWGVPQRRQRFLMGNLDFDLLLSYREHVPSRTLGSVLTALSSDPVTDPVYGFKVSRADLVDHEEEEPFSREESRINKDSKAFHPIYNNMAFPDSPERPSRTITATSTRVSRESIVIETDRGFRRPTLRESASLQSFPINYQFYGDSHGDKLKMIGNAFPPLMTFYIANAMLGRPFGDVPCLQECIKSLNPPPAPKFTKPEKVVGRHSQERRFRAAIPNLRFKSGVRFELSNSFEGKNLEWSVKFFFGGSKNVTEIKLGSDLLEEIKLVRGAKACIARAMNCMVEAGGIVNSLNPKRLQESWTHKHDGSHPHDLVDAMGEAVSLFMKKDSSNIASSVVSGVMASRGNPRGHNKVERNAHAVFAGLLVGSLVNEMLQESLQGA